MKRWWARILLAMLAVMLVAGGCAPTKPAGHEKVTLEVYTAGPSGSGAYDMCMYFADMLRELHPWLRGEVLESLGTSDAIHAADALPPARRKNAIAMPPPHTDMTLAQKGLPPYKRKFSDLKFVIAVSQASFTFVTYNPKLKTPQDLIGKKIAIFAPGSAMVILSDAVLKDAWGIYDKVTLAHHIPMAFTDLLVTGVADAAWGVSTEEKIGGGYILSSYTYPILGSRQGYWLNITKEDVDKVNQKRPWRAGWRLVPKGGAGKNDPPEDTGTIMFYSGIAGWDTADEEVIYELVKFMAENAEEWARRTGGRRMGGEFMTTIPGTTEDQWHPAALRYYKEKGIKMNL